MTWQPNGTHQYFIQFKIRSTLENFKIKIRAHNSEITQQLVFIRSKRKGKGGEEKGGGRSNETRRFPPPLPRRSLPAATPSPPSPATTSSGEKREPNLHPKGSSSSSTVPKPRGSVKFGRARIIQCLKLMIRKGV